MLEGLQRVALWGRWTPQWKPRLTVCHLAVVALLLALGAWEAYGGEPCCAITAINARTGVVIAREAKTRRQFQFIVTDSALLKSLKVGQKVYADFTTHKVSVDGGAPCCAIVQSTAPAGANRAKGKVAKSEACCSLTAIDRTTGVVSARNGRTGQVVSFKVNHAKFLAGLRVGQPVDLANIGGDRLVVRTDAAEVEAIRMN